MKTLVEQHDCLLLDLDGTVYRGPAATEGAVHALTGHRARALFVTNNASKSPTEVARHLCEIGIAATRDNVVTSAQSAAGLLVQQLGIGARVLVLGTEALAEEVRAVGLTPVRRCEDSPAAVVQGHSPSTGWPQLCEAALAIRGGAVWVATNLDVTLPSERGLLPGNGSMVAALATATGQAPLVAGKPTTVILQSALSRGHFQSPLVIGDRLDTDIAAANTAGLPSMLVLTGVSSARDAVYANPEQRPTHISRDLRGLHEPAEQIAVAPQPGWHVDVASAAITVTATGADSGADGLSIVRAVAYAMWDNAFHDCPPAVYPGDDAAWIALHRWSLLPEAESVSGRVRSASGSRSVQAARTPV